MDAGDLRAIEEIRQLKARYFRAVDEKAWQTLRELFTDDAQAWYPGPARWFTGPDEIVAWVSGLLGPGTISVHHGFMPEIMVSAPDRAEAIWAMRDDLEIPAQEGGGRRRIVGAGHYREEYRRVGGKWKIQRLVLTRLRVDRSITFLCLKIKGPANKLS